MVACDISGDRCAAARACVLDAHFNYLEWYYCNDMIAPAYKPIVLALVLVALFAIIGVAAYDFMGPNLRTLASRSGLSQSVLGVTLLAFGNSSVDIFGALAAIHAGSTELAIGEVVGAALFISTVVTGSMALLGGFQVERRYFIRDAGFLLAATMLLLSTVADGEITALEATVMVAVYGLYACVVVYNHFDDTAGEAPLNRGLYAEEEANLARPSLFSAIEFNDAIHDSDKSPNPLSCALTPTSPYLSSPNVSRSSLLPRFGRSNTPSRRGSREDSVSRSDSHSHYPHHNYAATQSDTHLPARSPLSRVHSAHSIHSAETAPAASYTDRTHAAYTDYDENNQPRSPNLKPGPSDAVSGPSLRITPVFTPYDSVQDDTPSPGHPGCSEAELRAAITEHLAPEVSIQAHLFPSLVQWSDKTWASRLNSLVMVPPLFVLSASVPVAENFLPHDILAIHAIASPIALLFLIGCNTWGFILAAATLVLVLAARARKLHDMLIAVLGFGIGVMWVVELAKEVVGVLRTLGLVLNLSESILGLTVFAIGDSLGDLVSNVSMAQIGFPTMAMSATFGGPLLTMLIGIGGTSLLVMAMQHKTHIKIGVERSIFVSGGLLLCTLLFLLVSVPINRWKMARWTGVVTIGIWLLSILLNIALASILN